MVERAVHLPETVEWPFFDDFVRGNLYTGQVMIRYIGGILFSCAFLYLPLTMNKSLKELMCSTPPTHSQGRPLSRANSFRRRGKDAA